MWYKFIYIASAVAVGCLLIITGTIFYRQNAMPIEKISINHHVFEVEVAATVHARIKGLSNRQILPESKGMYFLFPNAAMQKFTMRAMRFPIDIIWVDDNIIMGTTSNIHPESKEIYTSPLPVNRVLELPANSVAKYAIRVGDRVELLQTTAK